MKRNFVFLFVFIVVFFIGTNVSSSVKNIVEEPNLVDLKTEYMESSAIAGTSSMEQMQPNSSEFLPGDTNQSVEFTDQDDRSFYLKTYPNIYSMNLDGSGREIIANSDSGIYTDVVYEVNANLCRDMPEYRFVATGIMCGVDEWGMGFVMKLEIFDENDLSILSADFSETYHDEVPGSPVYNQMMDTMGLHIVDVNFDGYRDVIILNSFSGAHSNTWYDCWLWDSEASLFVESKTFAEICNPALDAEKKCIYSAGGSGVAYWGGSIYRYIDGEFIITNDLYTYQGGLVETELVNGKMEVVREVSEIIEDEKIAAERKYYADHELWQLDHPRWYWSGGHKADQWLGDNIAEGDDIE